MLDFPLPTGHLRGSLVLSFVQLLDNLDRLRVRLCANICDNLSCSQLHTMLIFAVNRWAIPMAINSLARGTRCVYDMEGRFRSSYNLNKASR